MTWDPSSLTGKWLWLRAKDNTGANGTAVTTWTDQSGLHNDGTAAGTSPTVATAATPSGGRGVAFAANGQFNLPNSLGPVATAKAFYPGETPADAFDGTASTWWTDNVDGPTTWLAVAYPITFVTTQYAITTRFGLNTRDVKAWTFEGSNDGTTWTVLDTQSAQTFTSGGTNTYTFTNATAYSNYRLNITANNGDASATHVAELTITGAAGASPSEAWIVLKSNEASGNWRSVWALGADTNAGDEAQYPGQDGLLYESAFLGTGQRVGGTTPPAAVTSWRLYRVQLTSTGGYTSWLDNTQVQTASGKLGGFTTSPRLGRGRKSSGDDTYFTGQIAEIVIIRGSNVSSTDAANLIGYFNTEHGLTVPGGPTAPTVSVTAVAPRPVAAFAASVIVGATMAAVAPAPRASFDADVVGAGSATMTTVAPRPRAAFAIEPLADVAMVAVAPHPVAAFGVALDRQASFAIIAPRPVASFLAAPHIQTTMTVVAPSPTASVSLTLPIGTAPDRISGRLRSGLGVVTIAPPVISPPGTPATTPAGVPIPAGGSLIDAYETAIAHGPMTLVTAADGRMTPTFTATKAVTARHRDRVLIGGVDFSYFRGVATPCPDYTLLQPFAYGSGTLSLPQVFPLLEQLGVGVLKPIKPGAEVRVQRVDVTTGAVVATDYIGFISAFDTTGPGLSCDLSGQVTGRASMRYRPVPVFRHRIDIGNTIYYFCTRNGARFAPILPEIGITLNVVGGMSDLDFGNQVMSMAVNDSGQQWTCMPDAAGVYRLALKDTTTVAATLYFDAGRMPANLRRDMTEEHNTVYASAVNDNGRRINGAVYPGLVQGPPPPYPFNDGRTFGIGTTDASTDDPAGLLISAMLSRLQVMRYLDADQVYDGYDSDVANAVRGVQADAGFFIRSGVMDVETWKALYDLSATGYSLAGAVILPMAQNDNVRLWDRTASGALIRRNPSRDPSVIPVEVNIDVGTGFNRNQVRKFAASKLSTGNNWVGPVTLTTALISGSHNPGDVITSADVMPARAIRPGMNVREPVFQGGTLFHVSGVSITNAGQTVQLMLDTRFRDTIPAYEVHARNVETRTNPGRIWIVQHRGSTTTKDSLGEWNDVGGLLTDRVRLPAQQWKVFPVVAGQEGIIETIDLTTINPHSEFVVLVTGRETQADWLQDQVPDPLSAPGTKMWQSQAFRARLDDEKILLYIAGANDQPCGYYPGQLTDANGATGDPLTGRWRDDAGFPFRTFAGSIGSGVLWVAIWAEKKCSLKAGRIMHDQMGAGQ